jgi:hypothetical protein
VCRIAYTRILRRADLECRIEVVSRPERVARHVMNSSQEIVMKREFAIAPNDGWDRLGRIRIYPSIVYRSPVFSCSAKWRTAGDLGSIDLSWRGISRRHQFGTCRSDLDKHDRDESVAPANNRPRRVADDRSVRPDIVIDGAPHRCDVCSRFRFAQSSFHEIWCCARLDSFKPISKVT